MKIDVYTEILDRIELAYEKHMIRFAVQYNLQSSIRREQHKVP